MIDERLTQDVVDWLNAMVKSGAVEQIAALLKELKEQVHGKVDMFENWLIKIEDVLQKFFKKREEYHDSMIHQDFYTGLLAKLKGGDRGEWWKNFPHIQKPKNKLGGEKSVVLSEHGLDILPSSEFPSDSLPTEQDDLIKVMNTVEDEYVEVLKEELERWQKEIIRWVKSHTTWSLRSIPLVNIIKDMEKYLKELSQI